MKTLKVQLEVRYKPLINFNEVYTKFVVPHLRLATEYRLHDKGTTDENLTIIYRDEGVVINFRNDRLAFIIDDKQENFFSANGPLYHFLGILDKLKVADEFIKIDNIMISEWSLFEIDKSFNDILSSFKNKNFHSASAITFDSLPIDDTSITINFKGAKEVCRIIYGPYNAKEDISIHSLVSPRRNSKYFEEFKGVLSQAIVFEQTDICDLETFRKLDKKIFNYLRQLKDHVV